MANPTQSMVKMAVIAVSPSEAASRLDVRIHRRGL
jgi:hypothetical protein